MPEKMSYFYDDISRFPDVFDQFEQAHKGDSDGPDIIITDVMLCNPFVRKSCTDMLERMFPLAYLKWVFFENSPEKCHNNVKSRTGPSRDVDGMIDTMSEWYFLPEGVVPEEIWQAKK